MKNAEIAYLDLRKSYFFDSEGHFYYPKWLRKVEFQGLSRLDRIEVLLAHFHVPLTYEIAVLEVCDDLMLLMDFTLEINRINPYLPLNWVQALISRLQRIPDHLDRTLEFVSEEKVLISLFQSTV